MPVHEVTENGRPGYKWGESGKTYFYTNGNKASENEAKRLAIIQGYAVQKSQEREGKKPD